VGRKKKSALTLARNEKARNTLIINNSKPKLEELVPGVDQVHDRDTSHICGDDPKIITKDQTKMESSSHPNGHKFIVCEKKKSPTHFSMTKKILTENLMPNTTFLLTMSILTFPIQQTRLHPLQRNVQQKKLKKTRLLLLQRHVSQKNNRKPDFF